MIKQNSHNLYMYAALWYKNTTKFVHIKIIDPQENIGV